MFKFPIVLSADFLNNLQDDINDSVDFPCCCVLVCSFASLVMLGIRLKLLRFPDNYVYSGRFH